MVNTTIKSLTFGLASMSMAMASHAGTNIQFALDWKFEGPSAPYFLAIDNGHFADAGLEVEISPGKGSLDVSTADFDIDPGRRLLMARPRKRR